MAVVSIEPGPGRGSESAGAAAVEALGTVAAVRCGMEARLIEAARLVVSVTGAAVLAGKGFTGVEELSEAQRATWRTETKRGACQEVRAQLGMGEAEARQLVGVACAPVRVRAAVLGALDRGEVTWEMVRAFWRRCGGLPAEGAELVADGVFGDDPEAVVAERLGPEGELRERPWHEADYRAVLEREARRVEGEDVASERERRRKAYRARNVSLQVNDDGSATLAVTGPVLAMVGAHTRIERAARLLRKQGDPRTLDQLRSDIVAALLVHGQVPTPGTTSSSGSATGCPGTDTGTSSGSATGSAGTDTSSSSGGASDRDGASGGDRDGQSGGASGGDASGAGGTGAGGTGCGQSGGSVSGQGTAAGHGAQSGPGGDADTDDEGHLLVPDAGAIGRVLTGMPAVQLQVVVPWDALAGRVACPTCQHQRPPGTTEGDRRRPPEDPAPASGVGMVLGRHPVYLSPGQAREIVLMPGTTLSRLLTDPADGRLIERSVTAYRPDAAMRRQVLAADVFSRAPGSRQPGAVCELDHVTPWAAAGAGGPTAETNLVALGKRVHDLKTRGLAFAAINQARDLIWTTLLGQAETTRVHDYRQYTHGPSAAGDPSSRSREQVEAGLREAVDRLAPLDPGQRGAHPSGREDLGERRDLLNRAFYAALAHRGKGAFLEDHDDHPGSGEHGGPLAGWMWVTRTTPGGQRRHGPDPDTPTVDQILHRDDDHGGAPGDGKRDGADHGSDAGADSSDEHDEEQGHDSQQTGETDASERPRWGTTHDDDAPPF